METYVGCWHLSSPTSCHLISILLSEFLDGKFWQLHLGGVINQGTYILGEGRDMLGGWDKMAAMVGVT